MLEEVDLSLKIDDKEYVRVLAEQQLLLVRLQQRIRAAGIPVIIMFEGWDASGKGGSILRLTEKLDPRGFQVWPIGAPDEIERQHHYLWRFWTRLPARGQLVIFDRSWYGRVLVERVDKLAKREAWERAYREIREFERMLVYDGVVLIKFWMQISRDEQLKRFKERENDPYKGWKITPDDWRNREKRDEYVKAAEEMFRETHTPDAPWRLIAAEHKRYGRIATLRIAVERLAHALA